MQYGERKKSEGEDIRNNNGSRLGRIIALQAFVSGVGARSIQSLACICEPSRVSLVAKIIPTLGIEKIVEESSKVCEKDVQYF